MIKAFLVFSLRTSLYFLLTALFISGCKLYKDPPPTDEIASNNLADKYLIPENWDTDSYDLDSVDNNWYLEFNDTTLTSYIKEALDTANPGIIFRLERIKASQAAIQITKSRRGLFVDYAGFYQGSTVSTGTSAYNGGVEFPIAWEADLWGRIGAGVHAANERMLAEVFNYEFTRQSIASEVAKLYFEIGAIQRLLEIGNQFRAINQQAVELLEKRARIGISNEKDVHLAKANEYTIESIIKVNENLLQQSKRALETLLGRYPDNSIVVPWEPEALDSIVQIHNPYSLISRRPDLKALESEVRSAFYLSEQAELAKYPSLVLTTSIGFSSLSGLFANTGANLIGPILNGKEIKSKILQANAFQKQVATTYALAIMDSFNDVETLLNSQKLLQDNYEFTQAAALENRQAYELTVQQYDVGQIDLYLVLLIQAQYLQAELAAIQILADLYLQRVQLYLTLGGNISN